LLCGIGAAVLVATIVSGPGPAVVGTPVVTTTVPGPVWIAPWEVVLGPAVLVPGRLGIDGNTAVLPFDLTTLSPLEGIDRARISVISTPELELDPADLPPVYPARWTLVTAAGELEGTVANPRSRTARFPVPEGFDPAAVEAIRLDGYYVPVPIDLPVALGTAEPAEIVPGLRVAVVNIIEQSGGFIVQVRLDGDGVTPVDRLTVEGDSPDWLSSNREAEFGNLVVLRYGGTDLPEPLDLRARGMLWKHAGAPVTFVLDREAG
jgi:hypothetical protein